MLILFSSYTSQSQAYNAFGITLELRILLGISLLICIGGVLGVLFTPIVNIIVEVICWILGIVCVGICCNEILFMLSVKSLNKPLFKIKSNAFKYIRPI